MDHTVSTAEAQMSHVPALVGGPANDPRADCCANLHRAVAEYFSGGEEGIDGAVSCQAVVQIVVDRRHQARRAASDRQPQQRVP